MRAQEFITEKVIGTLNIGGVVIIIDQHAMDRAVDRMVLPTDIDRVLRKIPRLKDQLAQLEAGQQFWVYDPELEVGLGCRNINPEQLKIQLKTVIGPRQGNPFDGAVPVLSTDLDQVDENFADGKKPGRKGLAKRMGVNCKQSVSKLRKIAKNSSGERARMAHWCANMKSGRKKAK